MRFFAGRKCGTQFDGCHKQMASRDVLKKNCRLKPYVLRESDLQTNFEAKACSGDGDSDCARETRRKRVKQSSKMTQKGKQRSETVVVETRMRTTKNRSNGRKRSDLSSVCDADSARPAFAFFYNIEQIKFKSDSDTVECLQKECFTVQQYWGESGWQECEPNWCTNLTRKNLL